jgi:hypothetical protein
MTMYFDGNRMVSRPTAEQDAYLNENTVYFRVLETVGKWNKKLDKAGSDVAKVRRLLAEAPDEYSWRVYRAGLPDVVSNPHPEKDSTMMNRAGGLIRAAEGVENDLTDYGRSSTNLKLASEVKALFRRQYLPILTRLVERMTSEEPTP